MVIKLVREYFKLTFYGTQYCKLPGQRRLVPLTVLLGSHGGP